MSAAVWGISYGLIDGVGDNADFTIGATDGRLSLTEAQDTPTTLTAAATVNDEHPNTPALTLSLTLEGGGCPGLYTGQGGHPHHNLSECALCLAYGDGGESKRRRRHLFIAIHIPGKLH